MSIKLLRTSDSILPQTESISVGFCHVSNGQKLLKRKKKNTIFFRVFIASSKHDGDSENFETVMQTRHAVNGLHYFRELSQKNPSCLGAM